MTYSVIIPTVSHEGAVMKEQELNLSAVVAILTGNGFIRVDGLRYRFLSDESKIIPRNKECLDTKEIRHAGNGGMMAIALPNGSVWVRSQHDSKCQLVLDAIQKAAGAIPVKPGCTVPLSNKEEVAYCDLFRRLANPEWVPEYHINGMTREAGLGQS